METLPVAPYATFAATIAPRWLRAAKRFASLAHLDERAILRRVLRRRDSRKKPTISAVADRADVAISTVSRVLNGGRASEGVRRRVQHAISELGYAPSVAARNLAAQRTDCIGLAVNSTQSTWFSEILLGIEEALAPSRKSVLLASMILRGLYDPKAVASWLNERRVDGLILVRFSVRDQPLFASATKRAIPVALIAPDLPADAAYSVRANNLAGGALVAAHLAQLGHRSVGFAGGPRESVDSRERLEGLMGGLAQRGISIDPQHVYFGHGYAEAASLYARQFLEVPCERRPTAVVLGNDTMGLIFMRAVLERGLGVPKDVSVIGFDGTPDGEQCWPGLTTVMQPTRRMSRDACRALLRHIAGEIGGKRTEEYPVELMVRESSGPPRG